MTLITHSMVYLKQLEHITYGNEASGGWRGEEDQAGGARWFFLPFPPCLICMILCPFSLGDLSGSLLLLHIPE